MKTVGKAAGRVEKASIKSGVSILTHHFYSVKSIAMISNCLIHMLQGIFFKSNRWVVPSIIRYKVIITKCRLSCVHIVRSRVKEVSITFDPLKLKLHFYWNLKILFVLLHVCSFVFCHFNILNIREPLHTSGKTKQSSSSSEKCWLDLWMSGRA